MPDPFAGFVVAPSGPATNHVQLVADGGADLDIPPRCIFCAAAGSITLRDAAGVDLSYPLAVGQTLHLRAVRVMAIASGTFYGLW